MGIKYKFLVAYIAILAFIFSVNTAYASIILANDSNESYQNSHVIVAGEQFIQQLGSGLSGTFGTFTFYGKRNSGSGQFSFHLLSCATDTGTSTASCVSEFLISNAGTLALSPAPYAIDVSSQGFVFNPARYYFVAITSDNTANATSIYGSSALDNDPTKA